MLEKIGKETRKAYELSLTSKEISLNNLTEFVQTRFAILDEINKITSTKK